MAEPIANDWKAIRDRMQQIKSEEWARSIGITFKLNRTASNATLWKVSFAPLLRAIDWVDADAGAAIGAQPWVDIRLEVRRRRWILQQSPPECW
jgi:hypothetical protein